MIIFKFKNKENFNYALDALNWSIDHFKNNKFDHNYQKKDLTIQVSEKNAPGIEALFKQREIKDFEKNRGYGKFSSDLRTLADLIAKSDIFQDDKMTENVTTKEKALKIVQDLYPGKVQVETMPGGLVYFVEYNGNRYQIANYDFEKKRLWHRIPKEYHFRKL